MIAGPGAISVQADRYAAAGEPRAADHPGVGRPTCAPRSQSGDHGRRPTGHTDAPARQGPQVLRSGGAPGTDGSHRIHLRHHHRNGGARSLGVGRGSPLGQRGRRCPTARCPCPQRSEGHDGGGLRGDHRGSGCRTSSGGVDRRQCRPAPVWLQAGGRGPTGRSGPPARPDGPRGDGLRGPHRRPGRPIQAGGALGSSRWRSSRELTKTSAATSFRPAAPAPTTSTIGPRRYKRARTPSWTPPTESSVCPFAQALSVLATVISVSSEWAVADCGLKSLGMDHGNPTVDEATVLFCSDEHLTFSPRHRVRVGDRISVIPAHVDPTVAYHEFLHVADGEEVWTTGAWTCAVGERETRAKMSNSRISRSPLFRTCPAPYPSGGAARSAFGDGGITSRRGLADACGPELQLS